MTASIIDKWKNILESPISHNIDFNLTNQSTESFPSLLPISMKIAAQTIGLDLVTVNPIGGTSQEEIERIKAEVITENRDRAIDSILKEKEYNPMVLEDHPDYPKPPMGQLFYMDYQYNPTQSTI